MLSTKQKPSSNHEEAEEVEAMDLRPANFTNVFNQSNPVFPQFVGSSSQNFKSSSQLAMDHPTETTEVPSPEVFHQQEQNSSYPNYSSASPSTVSSSYYNNSDCNLQNYIDSKPYQELNDTKETSIRQPEQSFFPSRHQESFAQFPHALKQLTDSLTMEPQYQHPRQHLQQFLQHQSQQILNQQSLTNHMISALNGAQESYNESCSKQLMSDDRRSPITRPQSQVSSDSSSTTPSSWQDNHFMNRTALESQRGESYRYSPSPVFPSNSPNSLLTGFGNHVNFTNREAHSLMYKKKRAGLNRLEGVDMFSRESSMCPDLPLETTLHEIDHKSSHSSSYIHDKPTYSCSLCSFTCKKQIDLTNHVGIHPDDKPFHCPHCEYKGSKYNYLKNHLLIHGTQKVHECPHCEYKSYQRGAVKVHMRKHSIEKKYGCPSCPYRTHFNGNLKLHIRVHTGEKPYVCPVCDFRCTQSGSLKIHMRGHSGEKPYACSACEYRTKHKGNLVMHQRKHSGERPFRCDHCSYATTQRMGLTKHRKTVHGIDPPPNKGRYPHQIVMYEQLHGFGSPHHSNDGRHPLDSITPHLIGAIKNSFLPKSEPLSYHDLAESRDAIKLVN